MALFEPAVNFILTNEGGFSSNPSDHGGATKYGISSAFLRLIGDEREVQDLTIEDAKSLYHQYFWIPNFLGRITNQPLSNKVFDMVVNMGAKNAIKIVQKACNQVWIDKKKFVYQRNPYPLDYDGIIGSGTLQFLNILPSDALIKKIRELSVKYYEDIVNRDPSQKVFLDGWLKRANL